MVTLEFGPADLLRCRFAVSPLWETAAAVRCLLYPRAHAAQLPWIRIQPPLRSLRLGALAAMLPERGYVPDFLTPPPAERSPAIDAELGRVRVTPPGRVHAEMRRAAGLVSRNRVGHEVRYRRTSPGEALLASERLT
jgi:hypothetical protein